MSTKHPIELRSLQKFIEQKKDFWLPALNILEIGGGAESLFEQITLGGPCRIISIDREKSQSDLAKKNYPYSEIEYIHSDLSDFTTTNTFDLIVDAHSLHFSIGESEISNYLSTVSKLLSQDGTFMGEVMTYNKGILFETPYYFDHSNYQLYKIVEDRFVAQRSILTAYQWEQHLLKYFDIKFFYVDQGLCFDLPKLLESKVSLLKFICKK
jgi:cyclopropane fatty-acyl-phospholipid synthase-like methyltransferase